MRILIFLCINLQELLSVNCKCIFSNGTLKLHFTNVLFKDLYESFIIEKVLHDLYIEDLVSSFNDENSVYQFYQGACNILMQEGFKLRKCITNFKN